MKRFISLVLSFVILLSMIGALPVNAIDDEEQPVNQNTDKLYNVDFTNLYTELGLTEEKASNTVENLGVKPIMHMYSTGTVGSGDCYNKLSAQGLQMACYYRWTSGFALLNEDCNIAERDNYSIKIEMQTNVLNYMYFGFGYIPDNTTYNPMSSFTNFRFNSNNMVLINGFVPSSNDDTLALRREMITNQKVATYSFEVIDGYCSKVTVSCGGVEVIYLSEDGKALDASKGDFCMTLRPGSSTDSPSLIMKNISVVLTDNVTFIGHQRTVAAESTYGLRFVSVIVDPYSSIYSSIGFDIKAEIPGGTVYEFTSSSQTVFRGIIGNVDGNPVTYSATDYGASYMYCATLKNIDATMGAITFTVIPYTISIEGIKTTYTAATIVYDGINLVVS